MSSNFNAWDTSESAGDLTGTLSADRASGPTFAEVLGQPGPVQPPPQAPAIAVTPFAESLDKLGQLGQFMASTQVPQKNLLKNISINTETGAVKIDTDQGALAEVFGQLKDLQTMKSAAMARVAQLRQQESSGSPILDALSQFAGNMAANDPTMPGWVRALGQTNLQMGPQGIKRERAAEEAKVMGLTKGIADLSIDAGKLSEYAETQRMKASGDSVDARRVAVAEKVQAANERNQILDNFRADLRPVMDVVGRTGLFNADQETAIRKTAANHPDLPPGAVESEIAKAKGNAAAARAEIDRKAAVARATLAVNASRYADRLAAQEGKQIRGQVVRANLAQAGKMADMARIDEKEAIRLQGLNEMAIASDRMRADLEADSTWQGAIAGRVAEKTQLTSAQQKMISNSADLFVKKMSSIGISFAKTSDAEMKKILATVPTASMTVAQAKRMLDILDAEGERTAGFIAQRNWAETPESLATALPAKYRDSALRAHADKTSKLTPQQRLAYGLATGDEGAVQSEVERAISGAPGASPILGPAKSSKPGEFKMAAPAKKYPWEK